MAIKVCVFDLDGTLYPGTSTLYQAMSLQIRSWFQTQLRIADSDMEGFYEEMKSTYPNPLDAMAAYDLSVASYHERVFSSLDPVMYLREDLSLQLSFEQLSTRNYVVTLSSQEHARRVLASLGIAHQIVEVVSPGTNWNTTKKFDAYNAIRENEQCALSEVCIVGDNLQVDLEDAAKAGYLCLLLSSQSNSPLVRNIGSITELPEIVSSLTAERAAKGVENE